jgi:hypothetical protein
MGSQAAFNLGNGVYVCRNVKLHYQQYEHYFHMIDSVKFDFLRQLFPTVKLIVLERKDIYAKAASLYIAEYPD